MKPFSFLALLCLGLGALLFTHEVFAYDLKSFPFIPRSEVTGQEGVVKGVTSLIQQIGNGLAMTAAAVAILFIVINGARLTFSFGNTEAAQKAQKGIIWSIAGLLVIIFAYVITKSVIALLYV